MADSALPFIVIRLFLVLAFFNITMSINTTRSDTITTITRSATITDRPMVEALDAPVTVVGTGYLRIGEEIAFGHHIFDNSIIFVTLYLLTTWSSHSGD